MFVELHPKWKAEFPEEFPWQTVASILGSHLATDIQTAIAEDLKSRHRLLVPGLREVLRLLARLVHV